MTGEVSQVPWELRFGAERGRNKAAVPTTERKQRMQLQFKLTGFWGFGEQYVTERRQTINQDDKNISNRLVELI